MKREDVSKANDLKQEIINLERRLNRFEGDHHTIVVLAAGTNGNNAYSQDRVVFKRGSAVCAAIEALLKTQLEAELEAADKKLEAL